MRPVLFTGLRASLLLLSLLPSLALPAGAMAEEPAPPLVVLLRPGSAGPVVVEALVRLRGELVANGFDVTVVERSGDLEPGRAIEDMGRRLSAAATIGFFGTGEGGQLELWVGDRLTGKTSIRRVDVAGVEGGRLAEVMAVRAVELLRASFVELLAHEEASSGAPLIPRPVRPPVVVVPGFVVEGTGLGERHRLRIGVEFGAVLMGSLDGVGPTVAPSLRLKLAVGELWLFRAGATGQGTRAHVSSELGGASVSQDVLLLEVALRARPGKRLRPQLSLGVGAYRLAVDGSADWPFESRSNWRWSAAADAGLGLVFELAPRLAIGAEVHALLAQPYPVVRFLNVQAASAGRPTLAAALVLTGWL